MGESLRLADMSISCGFDACLLNSASKAEMNGLRDIGRPPVLVGVGRAGEADAGAGDEARLRKGLLEEKLSERPGDGRRSGGHTGGELCAASR